MIFALGPDVTHLTLEEIATLLTPGGDPTHLTAKTHFRTTITQPFLTAYHNTPTITPQTPHSSHALLPVQAQNFHYLTLKPDTHGRPWLVFIEYINNTPHITGLGIDL